MDEIYRVLTFLLECTNDDEAAKCIAQINVIYISSSIKYFGNIYYNNKAFGLDVALLSRLCLLFARRQENNDGKRLINIHI